MSEPSTLEKQPIEADPLSSKLELETQAAVLLASILSDIRGNASGCVYCGSVSISQDVDEQAVDIIRSAPDAQSQTLAEIRMHRDVSELDALLQRID